MSGLVEVLAAHRWSIIRHRCRCEFEGTYDEWPDHVAEAVAAAELAIVQLPKARHTKLDGWHVPVALATGGPGSKYAKIVVRATPWGFELQPQCVTGTPSPEDARVIAAAYLAAANVAEVKS